MSDCLFCKIIAGDIPSKKVYEDDDVLVFHDIAPKAKVHLLIIPKKHITSVAEASPEDEALLGKLFLTAKKVADKLGIKGYKLLTNVNKEGGQVVFHVHIHLLAGQKIDLAHC